MANNATFTEQSVNGARTGSPSITVFRCANAHPGGLEQALGGDNIEQVKVACSAMVRDVFLLRAFEAGAEGVLVVACAPDECKRAVGSSYARKRTKWTARLLDEIGLGGWRLAFAWDYEAAAALDKLKTEIALHNGSNASSGGAAGSGTEL
jgi:coenzyme F420-reducing hydrogenase delta subunit